MDGERGLGAAETAARLQHASAPLPLLVRPAKLRASGGKTGPAAAQVEGMSVRGLVVKCADKLHNMRSLTDRLDAAANPEEAWAPFSRGPEQTIGEAKRLVAALRRRLNAVEGFDSLSVDLERALEALVRHEPS